MSVVRHRNKAEVTLSCHRQQRGVTEQSNPCSARYPPLWHLFLQGIVTSRGHMSKKVLSAFATHTHTHTEDDSLSERSHLEEEGVYSIGEW